MSQNQKRPRFIAIDLELGTLPKQEDMHTALTVGTAKIASFLDLIAERSQLSFTSVNLTAFSFLDKNAPDIAASLHGIAVYTGGADTETICADMHSVHENLASYLQFTKYVASADEDSDIIELEMKYDY